MRTIQDIPLTFDIVFTVGTAMGLIGLFFKELWWVMGGVLIVSMGIMFDQADQARREKEIEALRNEYWID